MLIGILFALAATLAWGGGAILVRLGLRGINPGTGTLISLMVGVPFTLVIALSLNPGDVFTIPLSLIPALALVGALNFQLGRLLNYHAIDLAGVSVASPIIAIAPLFATIIAVLFLDENLSVYLLLGTVSIVAGLGMIVSSR